MKNKYFGDINDYLKYGLLRELVAGAETIAAVCWMLTPDDGRTDGRHVDYLRRPDRFRNFDPELFDVLADSVHRQERAIAIAEKHGLIPGAWYYDFLTPDDVTGRRLYFDRFLESAPRGSLVFFDPDNGLEIRSVKKGNRSSAKFLYLDEVAATFERGHSILIYQHFPRVERRSYIESQRVRLTEVAPGATTIVVSTPRVAFFVLAQASAVGALASGARAAVARWRREVVAAGGPKCSVVEFPEDG